MPPAFILSQDQTLHYEKSTANGNALTPPKHGLYLRLDSVVDSPIARRNRTGFVADCSAQHTVQFSKSPAAYPAAVRTIQPAQRHDNLRRQHFPPVPAANAAHTVSPRYAGAITIRNFSRIFRRNPGRRKSTRGAKRPVLYRPLEHAQAVAAHFAPDSSDCIVGIGRSMGTAAPSFRGGKSGLHRAGSPVEKRDTADDTPREGKCHRKHTALLRQGLGG